MDGTGDHHIRWNKTDSEKYYVFFHMWNLHVKNDLEVEGGLTEVVGPAGIGSKQVRMMG
jgi:hypothetical protein